jgi:hypothetical protein
VRLIAAVVATLAAAGCSGAGESREETLPREDTQSVTQTETEAGESVPPARVLATLIAPETLAQPRHRYATLRELRWIGAWRTWYLRLSRASSRLGVIFSGYDPDPVAPRRFIKLFGRCSKDVAAFGRIPNTRLRDVAHATAEACELYEVAAAKLEENGGRGTLPREESDGLRLIEEADLALDRSFVGLSRETVPLPLLDRPGKRTRIQIRYTHVVSRLEAEQITVRCYDWEDWRLELGRHQRKAGRIAGFVEPHSVSANLAPVICRALDDLTYRKRRPGDLVGRVRLAQAVATLAHEAQHAVGVEKESRAECRGMQRIRAIARGLGASSDYAAGLADVYWQYAYPALSSEYRHARCSPGTRLDLHPRSPAWP